MGIIIGIWVSCFTCTFSKLFDVPDPQGDYFKCTHGWHKNMKGSYQKFHSPRKCNQHNQVTVRLIKCITCNKCTENEDKTYDCLCEYLDTSKMTHYQVNILQTCIAYIPKKESKKN